MGRGRKLLDGAVLKIKDVELDETQLLMCAEIAHVLGKGTVKLTQNIAQKISCSAKNIREWREKKAESVEQIELDIVSQFNESLMHVYKKYVELQNDSNIDEFEKYYDSFLKDMGMKISQTNVSSSMKKIAKEISKVNTWRNNNAK